MEFDQDKADSMAAASFLPPGKCSNFYFDGGNNFRLDWESSSNKCSFTPVFYPFANGSIGEDGVLNLV